MKMQSEVKPALWGAACGAVALAIVGFTWGGWVTGASAHKQAKLDADSAVVAVLSPICVNQFNAGADAAVKLAELKKVATYDQGSYIEKGGWATMPGGAAPIDGVARNCAWTLTAPV
jgi:hypothetical protein